MPAPVAAQALFASVTSGMPGSGSATAGVAGVVVIGAGALGAGPVVGLLLGAVDVPADAASEGSVEADEHPVTSSTVRTASPLRRTDTGSSSAPGTGR